MRRSVLILLVLLLAGGLLPVRETSAQAEPPLQIEFGGTVEAIGAGQITVSGVLVYSDGAFMPQSLTIGDRVIVTGNLLDDGTVQATQLVLANDVDNDGVFDDVDNCPQIGNARQADSDGDGIGDACDSDTVDSDGDGVADPWDNCPMVPNPYQLDSDFDGVGDACQQPAADVDFDSVPDSQDNCPWTPNLDQTDSDGDGFGDACDVVVVDADQDGLADAYDNCPWSYNPDQADADQNGVGDVCDAPRVPVVVNPEPSCVGVDVHPVALAIAQEFEQYVTYDQVIAWHCEGYGFGEIARALLLVDVAETSDVTPEAVLVRYTGEPDWAAIARSFGVEPDKLNTDRVIGRAENDNARDKQDKDKNDKAEKDKKDKKDKKENNGKKNNPPGQSRGRDDNPGRGRGRGK